MTVRFVPSTLWRWPSPDPDDIETSVVGLGAEVMQRQATYTRIWNDIGNLEETLRP